MERSRAVVPDNINPTYYHLCNVDDLNIRISLIRNIGIECAIWIAYVYDMSHRIHIHKTDKDGFFHISKKLMKEIIGFSLSKQSNIIKKLQNLQIIEVIFKGYPARNYYRLNFDILGQYCIYN